MQAPRPEDEAERLKSLQHLRVLDTAHEERFDRITRLAARVFDVPVSTLGFIDADRLWFKSAHGLALREAERDTSFCAHTILDDEPLVIGDTTADPRWAGDPTVWGDNEFLVVLPGADLARAAVAAERIRQARALSRVETSSGPVRATITIAVGSSSDDEDASSEQLLTAVTEALRLARVSGGNRTRLASMSRR